MKIKLVILFFLVSQSCVKSNYSFFTLKKKESRSITHSILCDTSFPSKICISDSNFILFDNLGFYNTGHIRWNADSINIVLDSVPFNIKDIIQVQYHYDSLIYNPALFKLKFRNVLGYYTFSIDTISFRVFSDTIINVYKSILPNSAFSFDLVFNSCQHHLFNGVRNINTFSGMFNSEKLLESNEIVFDLNRFELYRFYSKNTDIDRRKLEHIKKMGKNADCILINNDTFCLDKEFKREFHGEQNAGKYYRKKRIIYSNKFSINPYSYGLFPEK